MKISELELYRIPFIYPFSNLDWSIHPKKDLSSVVLDFCSTKTVSGQVKYFANVLNCFNVDISCDVEAVLSEDILFGPVLCIQPQLRGKNKWREITKIEKSPISCVPPLFYGATSNRKDDESRKEHQYYYDIRTSKYTESNYDQIGHLESTMIFNDLTIEVRVFIELLRLENIDENQMSSLLRLALTSNFRDKPETEISKWIEDFISESMLIPRGDLIPRNLRGKLKRIKLP